MVGLIVPMLTHAASFAVLVAVSHGFPNALSELVVYGSFAPSIVIGVLLFTRGWTTREKVVGGIGYCVIIVTILLFETAFFALRFGHAPL